MVERWKLRLETFRRTTELLAEALDEHRLRGLSELEQAGLIQRYEIAWEQGWKLMRDFLLAEGNALPLATPATVIRSAFAAGLINHGDAWMGATKLRNSLSHEYDADRARAAIGTIATSYLALFEQLVEKLSHAASRDDRPD